MNLKRTEILIFVVLAGIAIGWLIWSSRSSRPVDRYTGRRITVAEDILAEARDTGRAPAALAVLRRRREDVPDTGPVDAAIAALEAELAGPDEPPPKNHAALIAIREQNTDRAKARSELEERFGERMPAEAVHALLERLAADRSIAEHTERIFAGPAPDPAPESLPEGPDAAAAVVLALAAAEDRQPSGAEARAVAKRCLDAGRRRAWLRWLRRAFGTDPADVRNVQPLAGALVSLERQKEAFLVLGVREVTPESPVLWRLRAQVATWLARPGDEAEALTRLLALGTEDATGTRERLIELLMFLGQEREAFQYAKEQAASGALADQERAVEVALEAGLLNDALDLLEKIAAAAQEPRRWREQIVRIALNDLRHVRAIKELELLVRDHPDGRFTDDEDLTYAQQLEWLYRLRNDDMKLLALLKERLRRGVPADKRRELEDDIIYLAQRLDRTQEVREIFAARMAMVKDAKAFLESFWDFDAAGVEGRTERGTELLLEPGVDPVTALSLYNLLEGQLPKERRRSVLEALVQRNPTDARLDARYGALLDAEDPVASAARYGRKAAASPNDEALIRAWVKRTAWTDDAAHQVRAREALRALVPLDLENRRQLADLYEGLSRTDDARREWRFLAEKDGPGSLAEKRYLGTLLAEERYEEAVPIARRRSEAEGATEEDRDLYLQILLAANRLEEAVPLARVKALGPKATEADVERYLELLLATRRYEAALPLLLERSVRSPMHRQQFFDVLEALGRTDYLLEVLRDYAEADGATWDEKLKYADTLLAANRRELAREAFQRLLAERPSSRLVLLRLTQIEMWSGNPDQAVIYARRRLALPGDGESGESRRQRAEVLFLLGEALWSLDQRWDACTSVRGSVAAFEALRPLNDTELTMLAKGRARLGDVAQVRATYAELLDRRPNDINLRLDYVDALLAAERGRAARCELERARPLDPQDLRVKQQDAALLMKERRYERAIAPLRTLLERKGPDAALYADLGWAYKESGAWRSALWAWQRSMALKPEPELARAIEDLRFALGPLGNGWGRLRLSGDDTAWRVGAGARVPLRNDRWSIAARAEWARFEGPAAEVGGAKLRESIGIVGLSARRRFGRRHHAEAGAELYLDRTRGPVASPWAAVRLERAEPFRFVRVEAFANRLWEEPAAAVALGGRRHGATVEGWYDLSSLWWASGSLTYGQLTLDRLAGGSTSDGFAAWRATLGRRILRGDTQVSARVDYTGSRLLDDKELEAVVPVGRRFDFLTATLSAQRQLGMRLDAEFETFAGVDADDSSLLWGFEGAVRLRLDPRVRIRFAGGYGTQARYQDGDFGHLDLELEWTP